MDAERFDLVVRSLVASRSRRAVLGIALGGVLSGPFVEGTKSRKRRKKKKKNLAGRSCSCFNKVCGQDDGCGGKCTVQAGCDQDEACVNGQCVGNVCNPACTGNHICQPNGSCACPEGLKECAGQGFFGNCHECCAPSNIVTASECVGNPNGQYCADYFGELVFRCRCPAENCGGLCGMCCDDAFCERTQGSGRFCTANRVCACRQGLTHCSNELGCVDTMTNRDACGPLCKVCDSGFSCFNGACCTNECGSLLIPGQPCCVGTCTDRGPGFNPQYVCASG